MSLDYLSIALNLGVLFRLVSTDSEHHRSAFEKAENFIKRASEKGGVEPTGKPISMNFFDRKRTIKNARVDLEIHRGKTFIPSDD